MKSLYIAMMLFCAVWASSCLKEGSAPTQSFDLKGGWDLVARKGPFVNAPWQSTAVDDKLLYYLTPVTVTGFRMGVLTPARAVIRSSGKMAF